MEPQKKETTGMEEWPQCSTKARRSHVVKRNCSRRLGVFSFFALLSFELEKWKGRGDGSKLEAYEREPFELFADVPGRAIVLCGILSGIRWIERLRERTKGK